MQQRSELSTTKKPFQNDERKLSEAETGQHKSGKFLDPKELSEIRSNSTIQESEKLLQSHLKQGLSGASSKGNRGYFTILRIASRLLIVLSNTAWENIISSSKVSVVFKSFSLIKVFGF